MDFIKYILSRGLPKTAQVIESQAGDDGTYETGWWIKRLNANNRTRFVAKTIGGDVVVFDRATGLCWAGDGDKAGCNSGADITWTNAITYANGLDFAGFTDWRVPNVIEGVSVVNFAEFNPSIYEPPFSNTAIAYYLTSTTYVNITTSVWTVSMSSGLIVANAKTNTYKLRCVRKGL